MDAVGDSETLTKALAGNREALGRVLEACTPELRAHLSAGIGPRFQSKLSINDVLQITFIEALLREGELDNPTWGGYLRWLKIAADRNLTDAIRGLQAQKRRPPGSGVGSCSKEESAAEFLISVTGSDTPSRGAGQAERAELLEKALQELPPDYEQAIRQYDLEGKSIEEVAASLGRSEGAVHMLRARAKEQLKKLLGDTTRFFSTRREPQRPLNAKG